MTTPEHDFKAALDALQNARIIKQYDGKHDIRVRDAVSVKDLQAIRAALQLAINPWNDRMEDAPRDGTTVFGYNFKYGQKGMVSFNGHEWEMVDGLTNTPMGIGFTPTHWMPLPKPPAHEER